MKKLQFVFAQAGSIGVPLVETLLKIGRFGFLCFLLICVSAYASFAQAPGWSRGQQLLAITYDECVRRAPQALQAEGYRIDYAAGNFAVGIKDVHTVVLICNPAPDAKLAVNIVVASNGEGGGTERQRLQAQMERPGAVSRGGDNSFSTWIWAYGTPGPPLEVHGEVKLHADGRAWWSGDGRSGTWRRSGNQIVITWPQHNSVDTMYLSGNGTVMTGTNKDGWNIRATLKQQ
jgi:hypothetical protein